MKKMLLILVSGLLLLCMAGSAMADPFGADLWNSAGNAPADTTVSLKPGESTTFSFHLTHVLTPSGTYTYDVPKITAYNGGKESDISISPLGSFVPNQLKTNTESDGRTGYTDVGSIKVSLSSQAPRGAAYSIEVGAAGVNAEGIKIDSGSSSRTVNSVPEFPTVAAPVAAILGLFFILGRKKEGL